MIWDLTKSTIPKQDRLFRLFSMKRGDRATPCWVSFAGTQAWDLTIEVSYAIDRGRSWVRDEGIATVMLGLSGFRVLAVSEFDGGSSRRWRRLRRRAGARSAGFARLHDTIGGRTGCGIYPRPIGR